MKMKLWVKEKTIEMWVDELAGLDVLYNDCEIVKKHPFLLRIRLWLAMHKITRRNRKLAKFYSKNS